MNKLKPNDKPLDDVRLTAFAYQDNKFQFIFGDANDDYNTSIL
jgi:hypothetical protein